MIFGFKDSLRQAVEAASGGLATVMYTPKGQPLFMRRITPFRLEDLAPDGSLGTGWHPAFPNGREFWVSIYRIAQSDGEPISVPGAVPAADKLGNLVGVVSGVPGMRVLSLLEYSALTLAGTKALGDVLRGNDWYGTSKEYPWESGVRINGGAPGVASGSPIVYTGSGPVTWRHDHSPWGVELLGNGFLHLTGLRLKGGQIQIRPDGSYADPATSQDTEWYAWSPEGSLVPANSSPTLGFTADGKIGTDHIGAEGLYPVFAAITGAPGITIPPLMKALGLAPALYTRGRVSIGPITSGYRFAFASRGGNQSTDTSGPGTLSFYAPSAAQVLLVYRE